MGIYYALIGFALILSYREMRLTNSESSQSRKFYAFMLFLAFFVISALRSYYVGSDTIMYVQRALSDAKNYSLHEIYSEGRWEIGFAFLCKISLLFESPGRVLLVLSSLVVFLFTGIAASELSSRPSTSGLLLILGSIFFVDLQLMRQAIAMALILYGCKYLRKKTIWAYIVLVLISSLFHKSALVMLALPIIEYIISEKRKWITNIFLMLIAVLIFVVPGTLYIQVFGLTGYSGYTDSTSYWQSGNKTPILYALCFISWLIAFSKLKSGTLEIPDENMYSNMKDGYDRLIQGCLILGLLLCILAFRVSILVRLVPYCFIIYSVVIPVYNKSLIRNRSDVGLLVLLYLPYLMLFIFTVYIVPDWLSVFDYQFMNVGLDHSLLTI